MPTPPTPVWGRLLDEARRYAARRGATIDDAVMRSLEDLVDFGSGLAPEPVVSLNGQGVVVLSWPGLTLEVQAERIEVRRLATPESAPDFWFEPRTPGAPFSEDFERVLPRLPDWQIRRRDRR